MQYLLLSPAAVLLLSARGPCTMFTPPAVLDTDFNLPKAPVPPLTPGCDALALRLHAPYPWESPPPRCTTGIISSINRDSRGSAVRRLRMMAIALPGRQSRGAGISAVVMFVSGSRFQPCIHIRLTCSEHLILHDNIFQLICDGGFHQARALAVIHATYTVAS